MYNYLLCTINPVKIHPERYTQNDKRLVNDLDYDEVGFSVREKDFSKIETKTTFVLMCFTMKTTWLFQYIFQIKNLKTQWIESYEGSYSKKYQNHVPCSFAYELACVDNKFTKPIVVFRDENSAFKYIKAILNEYE